MNNKFLLLATISIFAANPVLAMNTEEETQTPSPSVVETFVDHFDDTITTSLTTADNALNFPLIGDANSEEAHLMNLCHYLEIKDIAEVEKALARAGIDSMRGEKGKLDMNEAYNQLWSARKKFAPIGTAPEEQLKPYVKFLDDITSDIDGYLTFRSTDYSDIQHREILEALLAGD